MLDNLRKEPESGFFQEDEEEKKEPEVFKHEAKPSKPRRSFDQITGTNAVQRFVLVAMLFLTICLLGTLLLVLTGRVVPSFLF